MVIYVDCLGLLQKKEITCSLYLINKINVAFVSLISTKDVLLEQILQNPSIFS